MVVELVDLEVKGFGCLGFQGHPLHFVRFVSVDDTSCLRDHLSFVHNSDCHRHLFHVVHVNQFVRCKHAVQYILLRYKLGCLDNLDDAHIVKM